MIKKSLIVLISLCVLVVICTPDLGANDVFSDNGIDSGLEISKVSKEYDTGRNADHFITYLARLDGVIVTPTLNGIENSDFDNYYTVSWESARAPIYILEEALDPSFAQNTIVYQGGELSWPVSYPGNPPDELFYRVKARAADGRESPWSNIQSVIVYPAFVGLQLKWDGVGYIRDVYYETVGWHRTREYTEISAPDTIRSHNVGWYDPDPFGWGSSQWDTYFSLSTGIFMASSSPPDPSWKWGHYRLLPYDVVFHDGQNIFIDGQPFSVSGPHQGYTAFGLPVLYWELVNTERFLFWDDGGDWRQYVRPGDAALRYDAGRTRLVIHSDVKRTWYYQGDESPYNIQYLINLTCADSFPGGECEPGGVSALGTTIMRRTIILNQEEGDTLPALEMPESKKEFIISGHDRNGASIRRRLTG